MRVCHRIEQLNIYSECVGLYKNCDVTIVVSRVLKKEILKVFD